MVTFASDEHTKPIPHSFQNQWKFPRICPLAITKKQQSNFLKKVNRRLSSHFPQTTFTSCSQDFKILASQTLACSNQRVLPTTFEYFPQVFTKIFQFNSKNYHDLSGFV